MVVKLPRWSRFSLRKHRLRGTLWGGGSKGTLLSHCPIELDITSDYGSQKPQDQPPHRQITQHSL